MPTLSSVAFEVLQHSQAEDINLTEVARVIGRDPALVIRIIKMANSPMFGLRNQVRSVSQALAILGLNCVRTLVLSFSLVRDSAQERQGALAAFWKRSVIASIAARELCTDENPALKEEAFLAGLLQDVGVITFARAFGERYEHLHAQAGLTHDSLREAEVAEFGADHAEAGAWLLYSWGLPDHLVQLVKYSHDSRSLLGGNAELFAMARRVEYSGRLADLWAEGSSGVMALIAEAEAASLFGEGRIDVAGLGSRIMAAAAEIAPLFELKLDEAEMASMLEQAKETTATTMLRLQSSLSVLKTEAMRDALTGLYNRRALDAHLLQRFASPNLDRMGVVFADVDHFKQINDRYGHAAGDAILRSVGRRLSANARAGDFVGRYGGEEFLLVVDVAKEDDILIVAERVRASIERAPHIISDAESIPVTVSVGCATARSGQHRDYKQLVEDADQALYAAKRDGRNGVSRAAPPALATTLTP